MKLPRWPDEDTPCICCDQIVTHDCDCRFSRFPKCEKCHGAYNVHHAVTGEMLSCLCELEAKKKETFSSPDRID